MQHIVPNNVAICWVEMLRAFARGLGNVSTQNNLKPTLKQRFWSPETELLKTLARGCISVNGENGTFGKRNVKTVEYVRAHASNVRMLLLKSRRRFTVDGETISSPEPAILLDCAKNRDLWARLKARQKNGQISSAVETRSFQSQSPTHAQNQTGTRISWFRFWIRPEPMRFPTAGQGDAGSGKEIDGETVRKRYGEGRSNKDETCGAGGEGVGLSVGNLQQEKT